MAKRGRKKKTWLDKLQEVDPYFMEEVLKMDKVALSDKIVKICEQQQKLKEEQKKDPDIAKKKEELKVLNSTYSEPIAANDLKIKAILHTLESRGQ